MRRVNQPQPPRSRWARVAVQALPAAAGDVPFIDGLRRRDSGALGFLSRAALAEKVRRGQVRVAVVDGRAAGFLLHGSMRRAEVRVFALAVDPSARGRGVARRLVADLVARSAAAGAAGLSLRCRDGLAANRFWHAAGFALHDVEPARRGSLFVWVRRVDGGGPGGGGREEIAARTEPAAAFRFHSRWHPCPRCGRLTCDTWSAGAVRRRGCGACAGG